MNDSLFDRIKFQQHLRHIKKLKKRKVNYVSYILNNNLDLNNPEIRTYIYESVEDKTLTKYNLEQIIKTIDIELLVKENENFYLYMCEFVAGELKDYLFSIYHSLEDPIDAFFNVHIDDTVFLDKVRNLIDFDEIVKYLMNNIIYKNFCWT